MTDHVVILRVSRDGSQNYGDATEHNLGRTGKLIAAERTRMGASRQLVLEEEDSSPFRSDIIAFAVSD